VTAHPESLVIDGVSKRRQRRRKEQTREAAAASSGGIRPADAGLILLGIGIAAWIVGLTKITPATVRPSGLLLGTNLWFVAGITVVAAAFLYQILSDRTRNWALWLNLVALIFVIHGAVPIIYRAPEYAWVYKHIGVISGFQLYGRVTDPGDIYQEWPAFFAGAALVASFAHVNALMFAMWAPPAFELANAVVVVAILRTLTNDRKQIWLSVLLYEGFVAWVGQDYLSPQAFAYLLWLGVLLIVLRWLRFSREEPPKSRLGRLIGWFTAGVPPVPATTKRMRVFAICLVTLLFGVIVTAHQITPYMGLASIAGLIAFDLIRPRWLILLLGVIAGGFFALHYHLVAAEYGGLFGGDPISNATGVAGVQNTSSYQVFTSHCVTGMAAVMWGLTFLIEVCHLRRPGRLLLQGILAFAPFLVVLGSNYGGEAIYRVYLFSAPWCAMVIADQLFRFPRIVSWPVAVVASGLALFAGADGVLALAPSSAFTASELQASNWLYSHLPKESIIVLPNEQFPTLQAATYNDFPIEVMPSDTRFVPNPWVNEGNVVQVSNWIASLNRHEAYIVISQSMAEWNIYNGPPNGYDELVKGLRAGAMGAVPVYKNSSTTVYRVSVT
jgi:hypothetical protein